MSARSTQITIVNGSPYTLSLASSSLQHGIWNGGPISTVLPNVIRVVAQNDSDGFMTGDQGNLTYDILDGSTSKGQLSVSWDNPYVGDNGYGWSAPQGMYICQRAGTGEGDNAAVTFVFCVAATFAGA